MPSGQAHQRPAEVPPCRVPAACLRVSEVMLLRTRTAMDDGLTLEPIPSRQVVPHLEDANARPHRTQGTPQSASISTIQSRLPSWRRESRSWASRLSRWPRWKNGKSRSRSSALSHCCCRRGQRIGLLPSEQLDPRLRFEGTPVPEGHRVAPKYSAEFDDQLARLSVRAATESHFDIVGVERFVVNEITRRLRRDVEQRQRPRAAMMSVRGEHTRYHHGP